MTTTIRRAKLDDIDAIVDLAIESVNQDPLPLDVDREAMVDMARQLIPSPAQFVWVGEEDGVVVACVAAQVTRGWWFKKLQASVLLFYTRKAGLGAALLREFARWVKSRPAIKLAVFSLERNADPRIGVFLTRLGFGLQNPGFTYCRGLNVQSS